MGKSTISMAIFNSYVKLPEGNGGVIFCKTRSPGVFSSVKPVKRWPGIRLARPIFVYWTCSIWGRRCQRTYTIGMWTSTVIHLFWFSPPGLPKKGVWPIARFFCIPETSGNGASPAWGGSRMMSFEVSSSQSRQSPETRQNWNIDSAESLPWGSQHVPSGNLT